MPLFMMKQRNYGDRVCHLILCSFHHNLPHYVLRKTPLEAISPETAAENITHRSTYGPFQQFTIQTAYGLTATSLKDGVDSKSNVQK